MSNQPTKKGHWESHSYAARATKIDDNPPVITGKESSAQGTFNQGRPVVTDSHDVTFTNKDHPGTIEYKDNTGNQQRSIQ